MAYSPDAVRAKLSTLNETQDSIVSVAQWLLFHRRHADSTAQMWLERLQSSTLPKRLNLIYLANEVVQQSRARGKKDFLLAFEPIVADGTASSYKGANEATQGKIKRVVEVWRQRAVFEVSILDAVDARLAELDRSKGAKTGGKLGGSLFGGGSGGGTPAELEGVGKSQAGLSKVEVMKGPAVELAEKEFARMTDPNATLPTPPVHAARLSALMRNLQSAQGAVEACVKARRELLEGLEKLVATNREKLAMEEATVTSLLARKEGIEVKKKEVEDGIMRGLSNPSSPATTTPIGGSPLHTAQSNGNGEAPEAESFTPPPPEMETFTPEIKPNESTHLLDDSMITLDDLQANPTGAEIDAMDIQPPLHDEPDPSFAPPPALSSEAESAYYQATSGASTFNTDGASDPRVRQASSEIPPAATNGNPGDPRLKRRKMSHPKASSPSSEDVDLFGAGGTAVGVDEDGVAAMLAGQ